MRRNWSAKVDENGEFWKDEKKYLVLEGTTETRSDKYMIIVSHSDLDGVTSALNMMQYAEAMNIDYSIYMERTSRDTETSAICKYAVNRLIENTKDNPYKEIEVVITDRMFLNLDTFSSNDYPDNVKFSWYDHHSGNIKTRDEIVAVIGENRLADYQVLTDIEHCGASISYGACMKRLDTEAELWQVQLYERNLRAWSYNVNLWDTFLWKQRYKPGDAQWYRGQKWGTVDKVVDDNVELLRILVAFIDSGVSLNSDSVYSWVNDCDRKYKELVEVAYNEAKNHPLTGFVNYFRDSTTSGILEKMFKIALVPAEWKFASNIKEKIMEEYKDVDIVITFHKTGGTVYTGYHVTEVESPQIARYIGEAYGLSGGGHKNAAGFSCRRDTKSIFDDETYNRIATRISFERIRHALDEFFYLNFKEVYNEWTN